MFMSFLKTGSRHVFGSGLLCMSGQWADAGLGDVGFSNTSALYERQQAAKQYDHFALGWRLGLAVDVHWSSLALGVGFDLRDLYGVNTDQSRTFMLSTNARIGFDLM